MSAFGGKANIAFCDAHIRFGVSGIAKSIGETTSNWLLKVHAPFWPEAFLYIGRTIDLARVGHALHQPIFAAARVCFRRCRLGCWRQAGRDDLLWLTEPTNPADGCAALIDGDESTVRPAANAVNGTPSIGIGRSNTD